MCVFFPFFLSEKKKREKSSFMHLRGPLIAFFVSRKRRRKEMWTDAPKYLIYYQRGLSLSLSQGEGKKRSVWSHPWTVNQKRLLVWVLEKTLDQACLAIDWRGAMCVQNFDDSLSCAIRITYRSSQRSSSLHEPRDPPLKVVKFSICFLFFFSTSFEDKRRKKKKKKKEVF